MKTASRLSIGGPKEGALSPFRARLRIKLLRWLLCIIVSAGAPDLAWAQHSSGGYSRPSGGSASGYSASSRRAPVTSSSGGYSRRSYGGAGYNTGSLGDRAISRSASSQALRDYQAAQQPAQPYVRRPPSYSADYAWPSERRPPVWGGQQPERRIARPALPGAGPLTAVALWAALNSLSSSGSTAYFHNYRYDPGYMQWRQEADREAAHNPAVAAKLQQLDTQLAQMEGQPPNPAAASPVQPSAASSGGSGFIWLVLFVGIAILVLLWLWRRRLAHPATAAVAPGLAGSAATRFRVGMTLPVDPSPFLLAAGLTKVQPLEGSGMVSVEVVGLLRAGGVLLHRLYLPGGKAFFQLHLGADGQPDECRYFSRLDEVTPANSQEWGLWLDPAEGMIGWPSFQTKDGKVYGRVWSPGEGRVAPRKIEETLQFVDHAEQRQLQMMLYGGPTGGTPPAPETEYILVSAIESTGQAWIEIDAGIDINPAGLSLPSVPLAA
jgi:Protein of unknown function (DUF2491)